MASNSQVLQEFLVRLRAEMDQASLKRWDATLTGMTKGVLGVSAALAGAAIAVEAYVAKIANQLTDLYFSSQRLNSSVEDIESYELSIERLGGTAQEARASLEALATNIRTNPGIAAFLKTLGVDPTNSTPRIMQQLSGVLRNISQRQGYFMAARYGEMLGLDEMTVNRLVNHPEEFKDRFSRLYKAAGMNADDAARSGKDFTNSLKDIEAHITVIGQVIAYRLMPFANKMLSWLEDSVTWLLNFGAGGDKFIESISKWSPELAELVQNLIDFSKVVAQLGLNLAKAFSPLGKDLLHGLLDVLNTILDLLTGKWGAAWNNAKKSVVDVINGLRDTVKGSVAFVTGSNDNVPPPGSGSTAKNSFSSDFVPRGVRNNNPGNLRFANQREALGADAGGFAQFGSAEAGVAALVRQLQLYNSRGINSVKDIISRYAPSNENNTAAYISAVAKKIGVEAGARLNLNDAATMNALVSAIIRHENGQMPYSQATLSSAVGSRMQNSRAVTLNQKTDIHVVGSADAQLTARAVTSEQNRTNGDAVRNMVGAVR